MTPIYCTDCLDRIPLEFFKEGKAAFSGGQPYLVAHAQRLGLSLDIKPPSTYAAILGFVLGGAPKEVESVGVPTPTQKLGARQPQQAIRIPVRKIKLPVRRCELQIVQHADGVHEARPPARIDLLPYVSKDDALLLGRESKYSAIFKAFPRVSRQHCLFWFSGGKAFVHDLSSANKTFVDGVELLADQALPFFRNQVLTLGAKHSALKITLIAEGYPFTDKNAFDAIGSTQGDEPVTTRSPVDDVGFECPVPTPANHESTHAMQ